MTLEFLTAVEALKRTLSLHACLESLGFTPEELYLDCANHGDRAGPGETQIGVRIRAGGDEFAIPVALVISGAGPIVAVWTNVVEGWNKSTKGERNEARLKFLADNAGFGTALVMLLATAPDGIRAAYKARNK